MKIINTYKAYRTHYLAHRKLLIFLILKFVSSTNYELNAVLGDENTMENMTLLF